MTSKDDGDEPHGVIAEREQPSGETFIDCNGPPAARRLGLFQMAPCSVVSAAERVILIAFASKSRSDHTRPLISLHLFVMRARDLDNHFKQMTAVEPVALAVAGFMTEDEP